MVITTRLITGVFILISVKTWASADGRSFEGEVDPGPGGIYTYINNNVPPLKDRIRGGAAKAGCAVATGVVFGPVLGSIVAAAALASLANTRNMKSSTPKEKSAIVVAQLNYQCAKEGFDQISPELERDIQNKPDLYSTVNEWGHVFHGKISCIGRAEKVAITQAQNLYLNDKNYKKQLEQSFAPKTLGTVLNIDKGVGWETDSEKLGEARRYILEDLAEKGYLSGKFSVKPLK